MGYTRCPNGGYKRTPTGAMKTCLCCPGCAASVVGGTTNLAPAPDSILAVVSGITLCTGCIRSSGGFGFTDVKIVAGSLADASYCLQKNEALSSPSSSTTGHCVYDATLNDPITLNLYSSSNGTCSGSVTSTKIIDKLIAYYSTEASRAKFNLGIANETDFLSAAPGGYIFAAFLYGNDAVPNCVDITASNNSTTGPCSGLVPITGSPTPTGAPNVGMRPIGYGGTISLVMNGC